MPRRLEWCAAAELVECDVGAASGTNTRYFTARSVASAAI
jgi:hypothetical protein